MLFDLVETGPPRERRPACDKGSGTSAAAPAPIAGEAAERGASGEELPMGSEDLRTVALGLRDGADEGSDEEDVGELEKDLEQVMDESERLKKQEAEAMQPALKEVPMESLEKVVKDRALLTNK